MYNRRDNYAIFEMHVLKWKKELSAFLTNHGITHLSEFFEAIFKISKARLDPFVRQ